MAISQINPLATNVTHLMTTKAMQASQKLGAKVHANAALTLNAINERSGGLPKTGQSQAFKVNISKTGMNSFQNMKMSGG
ncbi:MAG: hypothetical protein HQL75_04015 [Magnetococcales bacterium]|nr:hypothetical protein [Magnetococcales bacterium]